MPVFSSHKNHQLEYFVFGEGSKWMIAFHGFGRSANDFKVFENYLEKEYKILAVNLFCHGKSSFYNIKKLTKEDTKIIFDDLFSHLNIVDFSIVAYSIGGRFAFTLMELFPEKIKSVKMIAPDGLVKNNWITILNFTLLGQLIYKMFILGGSFIILILNFLKAVKLLDQKLYKFILINIETRTKREFAYRVWMTYRQIWPDFKTLKHILKNHEINFDLYIGIHDQVITLKKAKRFLKEINSDRLTLKLLDGGHHLITEKTLNIIYHEII